MKVIELDKETKEIIPGDNGINVDKYDNGMDSNSECGFYDKVDGLCIPR